MVLAYFYLAVRYDETMVDYYGGPSLKSRFYTCFHN